MELIKLDCTGIDKFNAFEPGIIVLYENIENLRLNNLLYGEKTFL